MAGAEGLEVDGEMRWDSQGEPGWLKSFCVSCQEPDVCPVGNWAPAGIAERESDSRG